MKDDLKIRCYTPADRDELFEIFRSAFGRDYDLAGWKWRFEENPFQPPGEPLIYVASVHGQVAGSAALLPVPFQVRQRRIPFAWGTDLMVHPRFRGRGIAEEIYKVLLDKDEITMSIGATDPAYHVLKTKTAWFEMKGFCRLSRYLDLEPYLRNRAPLAARPLGSMVRLALRDLPLRCSVSKRNSELQEVSHIGPEFDHLWQRVEPFIPISVCRTGQYLDWRYLQDPSGNYILRALYFEGSLRGYFVLGFGDQPTVEGFTEARIMELVSDPGDGEAYEILVDTAIQEASRRSCHVVRSLSTARDRSRFARLGFLHVPSKEIRFFWAKREDKRLADNLEDSSLWMLSLGDG
jgi:predicted N-acetyltransferase YhbS